MMYLYTYTCRDIFSCHFLFIFLGTSSRNQLNLIPCRFSYIVFLDVEEVKLVENQYPLYFCLIFFRGISWLNNLHTSILRSNTFSQGFFFTFHPFLRPNKTSTNKSSSIERLMYKNECNKMHLPGERFETFNEESESIFVYRPIHVNFIRRIYLWLIGGFIFVFSFHHQYAFSFVKFYLLTWFTLSLSIIVLICVYSRFATQTCEKFTYIPR